MDNPLKYKDLITPDDSITNAIKQLTELNTAYESTLKNIQSEAKGLKTTIEGVNVASKEQQETIKKTATEADQLSKQQKLYETALTGTVTELSKLKAATNEQNKINQLNEQILNSQKGSYQQLSAQYRLNVIELNKMSEAQRKGTAEGKLMEVETKKLYTEMKQMQQNTGAAQLNVGNYADALGQLPGPLGAAASSVSGLGKQFLLLLANPIVATIAAITAGVYILYESMTRTEEGQNKINKVMLEGRAIYNWVADSVTTLALSIYDLGNKSETMVDKVKNIASAWFELWKKTNPGIIAFKALIGSTDPTLKKAIDDARVLGNLIEEDQKDDRKRELENSELILKSNKLRADATELRKTDAKAGLKMMMEGYDLDKKVAENNLSMAKDKATIAQYTYNIGKKDTEAKEKLNQANIAVNQAEGAYDEQRIARVRKMNAMRTEDQAQELARLNTQLNLYKVGKAEAIRYNTEVLASTKSTYEQKSKALEDNANIEYLTLKKQETVDIDTLKNRLQDKLISQKDYNKEVNLIQKDFTDKQTSVAQKYWNDQDKLDDKHKTDQIIQRQKDAELILATAKKGSEQELDQKLKLLQIAREKELAANSLLAKDQQQSELKINSSYDKQSLDMTNKFYNDKALLEFDNQQSLDQSAFDLLKTTEEQKTLFRLNAEKARLEEILKLNKTAGEQLSDVQVLTMKNAIIKINEEIKKTSKKDEPKDIYSLLGIKFSQDDKENAAAKKGIDDSIKFAIGQVNDYMAARVKAADENVKNADREATATSSALDREIEARNNGYANNVATAQKEFEQAKKNQAKAIEEQKKAQKAQAAIQTIEQTGNLITTSTEIWKSLAGIPIVGTGLALAALAVMWGSFIASKTKAAQLTKATYGKGTYQVLEGGSHASGNDIPLGMINGQDSYAEGGEGLGIFTAASTRKYRKLLPDVVNSINKGIFESKYLKAFNHEGMNLNIMQSGSNLKSLESDVKGIREQGEKAQYFVNAKGQTVKQYKNLTQIIN